MRPRVVLVHGWGGSPEEGWFPWLKRELEGRGVVVSAPLMPDPDRPDIFSWVTFLRDTADASVLTLFVGHSLGAQAILRYLQTKPKARVAGAVFVAGFEHLGKRYASDPGMQSALRTWVETPIHWEAIRGRGREFTAIFSDDDSYVPATNLEVFSRKLGAETQLLHQMGHFSGGEGMTELPAVLEAVSRMLELEHAGVG